VLPVVAQVEGLGELLAAFPASRPNSSASRPSTTDRTAEYWSTAGVTCVSRLFEANYFVPRDLWKHLDHQRTPILNHTF
jgi:hypothetical protein